MNSNNLYCFTGELESIDIAFNVPQLGSFKHDFKINSQDGCIKLEINEIDPPEKVNTRIDYVVDVDYNRSNLKLKGLYYEEMDWIIVVFIGSDFKFWSVRCYW